MIRARRRPSRRGALVVGWLAAACAAPPNDPDEVVAVHVHGEITRAELAAWSERGADAGEPLTTGDGGGGLSALERLVVRDVLAQEAVEQPELAAAAAAAVDAALATLMRRQLGWSQPAADPAAARAYYDAHPERFARPERLRLQHIFLRADAAELTPAERSEVGRRIAGIRREIVAGADFDAMARAHSDSADGSAGGWMVLERGDRAVRVFTDAAWALEPGELSQPIDTATGFHIVRLATRIAAVERPFAEVAEVAAREAAEAERLRLESEYLEATGPRHRLARRYAALRGPVRRDSVLFALGDETFTTGDLLRRLPDTLVAHLYAGYLPHLAALLDQHALERLLAREARAAGLDSTREGRRTIAAATAAVRADFEIDRRLRERVAAVAPADLRELHARNRERYDAPRRRSLSVIRLAPEPDDLLWSLLRKGERMVEALRGGADLAAVGRAAGAAVYAGDRRLAGWSDEELRRVFGPARELSRLDELAPGEVLEPFVGEVLHPTSGRFEPTCVYIVRLDGVSPARSVGFAEVEGAVREEYLQQHRQRLLAELAPQVLATADLRVVVDDPALGRR